MYAINIKLNAPTYTKPIEEPAIETYSPIGTVTSEYGAMESFRTAPHTGIDYACPEGTELHAPVDGIVSAVKDYGDVGLGKAVFVKMEDGQQYVLGHLSEIKVEVGDVVKTGDLLALSGNTGNSTGPHLHFGAFDVNGNPIDPGNIPWDVFVMDARDKIAQELEGQLDPVIIEETLRNDPNDGVTIDVEDSGVFGWIGEKIGDGLGYTFDFIVDLVFRPLGEVFATMAVNAAQVLPMVFTVGGLVCFMLTMAVADKKPYFWGLTLWAASAVTKAMVVHFGL